MTPPLTLEEIRARLAEQAIETAALRSALDVQFTRIAQMQAQLDRVVPARRKRDAGAMRLLQPASPNGNGRRES